MREAYAPEVDPDEERTPFASVPAARSEPRPSALTYEGMVARVGVARVGRVARAVVLVLLAAGVALTLAVLLTR